MLYVESDGEDIAVFYHIISTFKIGFALSLDRVFAAQLLEIVILNELGPYKSLLQVGMYGAGRLGGA